MTDREQFQAPDNSAGEYHALSGAKRPAKIRKKVSSPSPSVQASQPAYDEDANLIDIVLVPEEFSYPVVQQPEGKPYFVSSSESQVTEFSLAKEYNNIGLLAHNNLAGSLFKDLNIGQEINIIYKDGHAEQYNVSDIYRFRALEPTNTKSQFQDLDSKEIITANELFQRMYTGTPHVTFQTCIYSSGDDSWGRLFVIATPAVESD